MCPACLGTRGEVSVGYPERHTEPDANYTDEWVPASCGCGWNGITEQLFKPEERQLAALRLATGVLGLNPIDPRKSLRHIATSCCVINGHVERWVSPLEGRWDLMEFNPFRSMDDALLLQAAIEKRGYWMKLTSPWEPGSKGRDVWNAGFVEHGFTGWNGRSDIGAGSGTTAQEAITKAAMAWLEYQKKNNQENQTDGN